MLLIAILAMICAALWPLRELLPGAWTLNRWPLVARPVLTARERALHQRLVAMYPNHHVFAQVALSQVIDVQPGVTEKWKIRARFKQLVADFLLCRSDYSIVAFIELDDASHLRADRQDADARKSRAIESAGLRLVRIPAGPIPSEATIRQLLDDLEDHAMSTQNTPLTNGPRADSETTALIAPLSRAIAGVILIAAGWFVYSQWATKTIPTLIPIATAYQRTPPAPVASPMAAPVDANLERQEQQKRSATQASAAQELADDLTKRKEAAWAAYYVAPAMCDDPPTWADQVECGNQYMRAKRAFEAKWRAEHGADR